MGAHRAQTNDRPNAIVFYRVPPSAECHVVRDVRGGSVTARTLEGSTLMEENQDHGTERVPRNTRSTQPDEQQTEQQGEQQGTEPFLRRMRQVERQGVPEEGAVKPGPPPRPVRSGEFNAEHAVSSEEEQEQGRDTTSR